MQNQYYCKNKLRREMVRNPRDNNGEPIDPKLNGIDYLEVDPKDQKVLYVFFLHNLPGAENNPVPNEPDFTLTEKNFVIEGGERIRDISVKEIDPKAENLNAEDLTAENVLKVTVNETGDFSAYKLRLVKSADDPGVPEGFDPQLSEVSFSFKAACSKDFDCKDVNACPAEKFYDPEINYLAKDYASFRQLILDRLALLVPEWKERNPSDIGMVLVELLAYVGDHLSYQQDAIATEAYLGTARKRVSVRRHARLVDYHIQDGCNARVWVHVEVNSDIAGPKEIVLPKGTKLLTCRAGQQRVIKPLSSEYYEALDQDGEIFEIMYNVTLYPEHNELYFYTWGENECCLPKGSTRATLKNYYPKLNIGDVLIFKEIVNPSTGYKEDADPGRRHAVRLTNVSKPLNGLPPTDPLNGQEITEIEWHTEDALPFPLCISTSTKFNKVKEVSIALGNIALADHGCTIDYPEYLGTVPAPKLNLCKVAASKFLGTIPKSHLCKVAACNSGKAGKRCETNNEKIITPPRFRPHLNNRPLTHAAPISLPSNKKNNCMSASSAMHWKMNEVLPEIWLYSELYDKTETQGCNSQEAGRNKFDPKDIDKWRDEFDWNPKFDLLDSDPHSHPENKEFVVEVESNGTAYLRFGDCIYGARPEPGTDFYALYRVGNGVAGNVGAETLIHIVTNVAGIKCISNPLPASGGQEPESIEDVRKNAPNAFRRQERAVTAEDYEEIVSLCEGIQRAAATFRWTGSWYTVFVTVDRLGGKEVDPKFKADLYRQLEKYRMAGQDVEIDSPRFVPLEIEMQVSVRQEYFRSNVKEALLQLFSSRTLPDGRRGIFHPDNFTFGQSVYVSPIIAAAQSISGVDSVKITKFQRQWNPSDEALKNGELKLGRLEIALLDNNPNFPDRGVFILNMEGGK